MENSVQWERHPVRDCFHVYSDGTRLSVLFETIQDKVYARNLIAILAFLYHIRVYCDVVMDTHFHLVGHGKPEAIDRFMAEMKRLFFHVDTAMAARRVGDMTVDERRAVLHTRVAIPDEWEVDANGMILPRSYIDFDTVRRMFGSPKRFIAFLFVRKKDLATQDEQCARAV